ncbi:MAG: alpha/beta hydrolase [SAR202 cluster bacterium]|nr:alpha/beta hydrolase [SAR202 cluster bacterium]
MSAEDLITELPADGEDRFVIVRGVRLRYVDWGGDGPLMLLQHGDMRTARSWDAMVRDIRHDFHVLSLDAKGHGDSEWPTEGYKFSERVQDLEAFCDTLGLRNIHGVGHSSGGVVVSLLADSRPDIFSRLTLLEPMVTVGEEFQRMVSKRAEGPRRTWPDRPTLYEYLKAHPVTGRWRDDVVRDVVAHEAMELPDGSLDMKWATASMDWGEREGDYVDLNPILWRLGIPIMFIMSDERRHERPFSGLDRMSQELPAFNVITINDSSHNMYMNRPSAVSGAIQAFVRGETLPGAV